MDCIDFNSLKEFIELVTKITLKDNQIFPHEMETYWFRGHSNSSWKLIPKIHRPSFLNGFDFNEIEEGLINDFIMYYILHDKSETRKWDTLVKMQHHGIATRLLDWSESALVALFFAVEKWDTSGEFPCVWVMNPIELNNKLINRDSLLFSEGEFCNAWLPESIARYYPEVTHDKLGDSFKDKVGKVPLAMNYKHIDNRSVNQRGTFVVFPGDCNDLESYTELNLIKLNLRCKEKDRKFIKKKILAELDILGINSAVAYPDLQGLNTYLTWKFTGNI